MEQVKLRKKEMDDRQQAWIYIEIEMAIVRRRIPFLSLWQSSPSLSLSLLPLDIILLSLSDVRLPQTPALLLSLSSLGLGLLLQLPSLDLRIPLDTPRPVLTFPQQPLPLLLQLHKLLPRLSNHLLPLAQLPLRLLYDRPTPLERVESTGGGVLTGGVEGGLGGVKGSEGGGGDVGGGGVGELKGGFAGGLEGGVGGGGYIRSGLFRGGFGLGGDILGYELRLLVLA
jgi:hypothetical protein